MQGLRRSLSELGQLSGDAACPGPALPSHRALSRTLSWDLTCCGLETPWGSASSAEQGDGPAPVPLRCSDSQKVAASSAGICCLSPKKAFHVAFLESALFFCCVFSVSVLLSQQAANIVRALELFVKPDVLSGENAYMCAK